MTDDFTINIMKRFIKIFSVIVVAVAGILVAVLLIKARRPEPLILAELRLKGYETNGAQEKVAVFELRNPGRIPVDYDMYKDPAGDSPNIPVAGELDGHATNILRMTLTEQPTRLMLSCVSRDTLKNLADDLKGLVGKRPPG